MRKSKSAWLDATFDMVTVDLPTTNHGQDYTKTRV